MEYSGERKGGGGRNTIRVIRLFHFLPGTLYFFSFYHSLNASCEVHFFFAGRYSHWQRPLIVLDRRLFFKTKTE